MTKALGLFRELEIPSNPTGALRILKLASAVTMGQLDLSHPHVEDLLLDTHVTHGVMGPKREVLSAL